MLQDATSAEPKPGVFAIVRGIRARSANVRFQTRHLVSLQLHQVGSLTLDLLSIPDELIKLD